MKYLFLSIFSLFIIGNITAQSGFTFQSVIRNDDGTPQENTTIYLKFDILDGSGGTSIYSESQNIDTDEYGFISATIGDGNVIDGNFTTIDWFGGEKYLIIACSDDNGASYADISSSLINGAPFVGPRGPRGPTGNDGAGVKIVGSVTSVSALPSSYSGEQGDMYITSDDGAGHVWDGVAWINIGQIQGPTGPAGTYIAGSGVNISGSVISATDNSLTNEIQQLEFTGTTLTLSNGGGTINLETLSNDISLPYFSEGSQETALFHIHNGYDKKHYGIAGTIGNDSDIPEGPGAGVVGVGYHGVYGLSEGSSGAGVLGETSGDEGIGVQGISEGEGYGGYFETTVTGRAALATGEGNVGIGTKLPKSKLEISDDHQTRLTLNGQESGGLSSLAFKQFQGFDSYQGWMWESDISDISKPSLSLYDYDYLIGTPENENKYEMYSINKETILGQPFYTHKFSGSAAFDNVIELHGEEEGYTLLSMIPEVVDSIQKRLEIYTYHNRSQNRTKFSLDFLDMDIKAGSIYNIPQNMYTATHFTGGNQRHDFGGDLYINHNPSGSSSMKLLVPAVNAERYIYQDAIKIDDNITYSLGETSIGTSGGGASTNPLYVATSDPVLSASGLGGSHWFYGHVQTNGFSITDDPFTINARGDSKVYINSTAESNQVALHIDAENETTPAMQVHNTLGGAAIEAVGPIYINLDGATTKEHQFIMQQKPGLLSYGMLLQSGFSPFHNWEMYVDGFSDGDLRLFFDNSHRGTFNSTSGNYSSVSDARLKTNISSLSSVLPSLLSLLPKKYNYRSDLSQSFNGFLAQDIQRIFPEIVTEVPAREGGESTLMVDYSQLSVLTIKAIQEQQEIIMDYKARFIRIEKQLEILMLKVKAIEE